MNDTLSFSLPQQCDLLPVAKLALSLILIVEWLHRRGDLCVGLPPAARRARTSWGIPVPFVAGHPSGAYNSGFAAVEGSSDSVTCPHPIVDIRQIVLDGLVGPSCWTNLCSACVSMLCSDLERDVNPLAGAICDVEECGTRRVACFHALMIQSREHARADIVKGSNVLRGLSRDITTPVKDNMFVLGVVGCHEFPSPYRLCACEGRTPHLLRCCQGDAGGHAGGYIECPISWHIVQSL